MKKKPVVASVPTKRTGVPKGFLQFLERGVAQQPSPIVCREAGLVPLSEEDRAGLLALFDGETTIRAVAAIQSKLDVAVSTSWTQDRVERDLLADAEFPQTEALAEKVRSGRRLIPPRSVTQLLREVFESAVVCPDAEPISTGTLLHLILSITTGQLRNEFSEDGTIDADGIARMVEMAASKTAEESMDMLREIMVDEVANLHSNAPAKLETLLASTENIWFCSWPAGVVDPRLGTSPAECFAAANGIDLVDVLALGLIIAERASAGQIEFCRADLVGAGATGAAVTFLVEHMALSVPEFQRRLARDRRKGDIADQRYTLTQCPFLRVDDDTVVLLRYQWGIERFFGSHLYWQTFFSFGKPEPRSVAEAFSLAMNDVFEEATATALGGIVAASRSMTRVVRESEMQAAWAEDPSRKPSVCDFVIPAGSFCFALDATNHHLNEKLAQGLAGADEYAADAEKSLVKKCNQIAATIRQLHRRREYGVGSSTVFLPFVIVPAHGVPNLGTVEWDLRVRANPIFALVRPPVLAPTVLSLSDLELLEGIAEHYQRTGRDIRNILVDWRQTSMQNGALGPIRLQDYLDSVGLQRPISNRMLKAGRRLKERLRDHSSAQAAAVG
ncbi:hypothetical protein [Rhodococcus pyridinivorans]|uniref:hypothetical protein n=1 Tax=Rhodococcus pyridinivorans TaxID=103816 RepID=UPI0039B4483F